MIAVIICFALQSNTLFPKPPTILHTFFASPCILLQIVVIPPLTSIFAGSHFCAYHIKIVCFLWPIQGNYVLLRRLKIVRKGMWVKSYWYKGRLRTLTSTVESRKFSLRRETQPERPLRVYCTLLALSNQRREHLYNISRRGLSRVAYPNTRQCESRHVG